MRRHRLTASVLRARLPPSPRQRLSGYGGGGAGLYLYRFPARADGGAGGSTASSAPSTCAHVTALIKYRLP
jgi:hypothetical protein